MTVLGLACGMVVMFAVFGFCFFLLECLTPLSPTESEKNLVDMIVGDKIPKGNYCSIQEKSDGLNRQVKLELRQCQHDWTRGPFCTRCGQKYA